MRNELAKNKHNNGKSILVSDCRKITNIERERERERERESEKLVESGSSENSPLEWLIYIIKVTVCVCV